MSESQTPSERRILRPREVCRRVGISEPTLWRLRQRGEFPAAIRITSRLIGFDSDAIEAWLTARSKVA